MKKLTPIAIAALALALQTGLTTAQERNRERPERPRQQQGAQDKPRGERARPVAPLMRVLDTNHDGLLDQRELENANNSLATLDGNKDGRITQDEIRATQKAAQPPARGGREGGESRANRPEGERAGQEQPRPDGRGGENRPGRQMAPPLFSALDSSKDGTLDTGEIEKAPASLRTLDKNADGQLTPNELRPQRPEGAGRERTRPEERPAPRSRPNPQ